MAGPPLGEISRRISESGDEIELTVKAERTGLLTHFETQIDERIAQLGDRISALETTSD